ncbi:unannotated protein [freshwater metagenome]|uniref:Unannotated protein n=1 Tax=freshwater metagenome TaxID=449393 RepID=A0A6J7U463_9ZZZZ|nr:hypothetical protein [Actinomycetota bacterium]MTH92860.1 hypothetical protein [Actinomycetota bacterium]
MNRFLTKKMISSIVALTLLLGVGVLIASRDTSSTTRNAALVAGTPCKKPGQVTKVSKQSVVCAALSPKNIWYPVFQEKKWICAKLGGSRKQGGIYSVCGKNKSSKKRWFLTMPLTSKSNAGLPTTDQDAFIKLTTNPELIVETSPTTPIALAASTETTLIPATETTRASNTVSTTTVSTSTTTAPRSTTTAPTSTTGATGPNIVRVPIEVVPAIDFGPATPYPERVSVSLYKLGVGTDCSTVPYTLVTSATSARIGSQEIATFTDIPSGTYYVGIGGCDTGTVGDFDRRNITTYRVLIDASLPSQLTTPIRLSKTTRSVTASASIRGTQSAITSMTLSGGFLSDDLAGEATGSGSSTTYFFWGVPPGVYTLTMVQSPYPNRLERVTVGDRNLVTPTYEMSGMVVVPTTPILVPA